MKSADGKTGCGESDAGTAITTSRFIPIPKLTSRCDSITRTQHDRNKEVSDEAMPEKPGWYWGRKKEGGEWEPIQVVQNVCGLFVPDHEHRTRQGPIERDISDFEWGLPIVRALKLTLVQGPPFEEALETECARAQCEGWSKQDVSWGFRHGWTGAMDHYGVKE